MFSLDDEPAIIQTIIKTPCHNNMTDLVELLQNINISRQTLSTYKDIGYIIIELDNEVDRRWLESKLHHKYDTIFEHKKV